MTSGDRRAAARLGSLSIVKAGLAIAAGGLLALIVVGTAAVEAQLESNFVVPLASAQDPRIVLAQAAVDVGVARGSASQAVVEAALQASLRAPLHEAPFAIAGARALRAGEGERAERLLTEARQRNPRSRVARFLLLERYVRTSRTREAAAEMAVLTRLMPEARRMLIAALADLAENAPRNSAIADVLRSDPAIQQDVLDHLAARHAPSGVLLHLAAGSTPSKRASWPRLVLSDLVERGDVYDAYEFWRRLAGVTTEPTPPTVYNSNFDELPAPPPFNWRFVDTETGTAQPLGAGALRVEHSGGARIPLASQLLLLPSGHYTLSFKAKDDAGGSGATFTWTLRCHRSNIRLASVPVAASPVLPFSADAEFTVPAGCSAQWLTLSGAPQPATEAVSATISDFIISRSDGTL